MTVRLRSVGALLSLVPLLIAANPVSAKGLFARPPVEITIQQNYTSLGAQTPTISSDKLGAVTSAVQNLGTLYNSTWKPAIHTLLLNNNRSLDGSWIEDIGVNLYPSISGVGILPHYSYGVYVYSSGNAQGITMSLSTSDPIIEKLMKWNLSLFVPFGFAGQYFAGAEGQPFAANSYMQRLTQLTPQLVNATQIGLQGRPLGALVITILDENVVHFAVYSPTDYSLTYSTYFGTSGNYSPYNGPGPATTDTTVMPSPSTNLPRSAIAIAVVTVAVGSLLIIVVSKRNSLKGLG